MPLSYASALVWAAGRSVRILVPFLPLLGVALAIVIGVAAGTGVHALCRRRAVPWLSRRGARLAAPLLAGAAGTLGSLWLAALDVASVMQVVVCVGIAGGYWYWRPITVRHFTSMVSLATPKICTKRRCGYR